MLYHSIKKYEPQIVGKMLSHCLVDHGRLAGKKIVINYNTLYLPYGIQRLELIKYSCHEIQMYEIFPNATLKGT